MKDLTKLITGNKMTTTLLSLLIVLYSALAAPALPNSVILFFDTWYGKLLFMFLIGFVASHNIQVALVISILFFIILNMATKLEVEQFMSNKEYFEEKKSPDLSTDTTEQFKKILCDMVMEDKLIDMKMNVNDYVSKNMDVITTKLNIDVPAVNSMLKNMPNTKLSELCAEKKETPVSTNEKFENQEMLSISPADPSQEVGAPVDF
jgi:hypothetical protein